MRVRLQEKSETHEAAVERGLLLVQLTRDVLRLTGTHIGCDTTHCGACTVLLEGRAVKSCTMFAVQANGKSLMTVEGLEQNGKLHPLRRCGRWPRDDTQDLARSRRHGAFDQAQG